MREWISWDTTCQRRVVVNEELEEMVRFVRQGVDGASEGLRYAVAEREDRGGFVADGKGDVLQVAMGVRDVFTCVAANIVSSCVGGQGRYGLTLFDSSS